MKLVEYSTREEAEAIQAKVDAEKGYPAIGEGVCQAVPLGGGIHVTHPLCCTVTHVRPIEGKTGWAMPVDDAVREQLKGEPEIEAKDWVDQKDSPVSLPASPKVAVAVDAEITPEDPVK